MKHNVRNILLISMLIFSLYVSTVCITTVAEPTVESITYSPDDPAPESTITFNVTVAGGNISAVYLIIEECTESLCYLGQNVTMNNIDTNRYQAVITLTHDDATYVIYYLDIESDGIFDEYEKNEFNLSAASDGIPNDGDDSNKTPGFELIPVMISIVIIVFISKRKRER